MSAAPTVDELWAANTSPEPPDDDVPRNHHGWPMIVPLPADKGDAYKSGPHKGLVPYFRSSYYGGEIEDRQKLVEWQKRQVARGVALLYERAKLAPGPTGGLPRSPLVEPDDQASKKAWDGVAEAAEEEVGSYRWAKVGTAIHYGTELVDLGGSLDELAPEIRERAEAYWRAKREWGWRPTSVEVFGVEDENRVAGTWDRTMHFFGRHVIGDVKTSGTMDFAGIGFAVQLWEYANMKEYDHRTGARTPREVPVDLETGWIIHVDRNPGGPVTLHKVDLTAGARFAGVVRQVMDARNVGKKAIGGELDASLAGLSRCTTRSQIDAIMSARAATMSRELQSLVRDLWKTLPA